MRTVLSSADIRLAQERIQIEEASRAEIQVKREAAADSVQALQATLLESRSSAELSGELGPLRYLSGVTGWPMDRIVNILLLVIIFVFDPLAISLVLVANIVFAKRIGKKKSRGTSTGGDSTDS